MADKEMAQTEDETATATAPEEPPPEQEAGDETPPDPKGERGTKYVDDFGSPEAEKRFKRVYSNMKGLERQVESLREFNDRIAGRLEEVLQAQTKSQRDRELSELDERARRALADGDMEGYHTFLERKLDLKTEPVQKEETAQKPQSQKQPDRAAVREAQAITEWMFETNEDGSLVRPWAADPKKQAELRDISVEVRERMGDAPLDELLEEVDRVAKSRYRPKASSGVMTGGAGPKRKSSLPELTAEEKQIAIKMGLGKSPEDSIAKYQQRKQLLGSR